jgi:hypothetical protein
MMSIRLFEECCSVIYPVSPFALGSSRSRLGTRSSRDVLLVNLNRQIWLCLVKSLLKCT